MFNKFAIKAVELTGSPAGFLIAFAIVLGWAITGPAFKFSEAWSICINTITTIITFLMVFVIQYSQNKDTAALHLKIDELIKSSNARNELAGIEELPVKEIKAMKEKPIPPVDRRSSEGVLPDEIKAMKETNY